MVNEFEKDVQSKRNDFLDSVVGFIVPFGFFMTIFIIAQVIHFFGTN
ncbi:MAG: YqzM family protein [Bacillus sp. (in: Bacteria)]|nr:YqzM family protein [Bacillus sp. (in: firmicutes)]